MGRFNGYSLVDNRSTTYTIAVDLSPELSVPRHVRYNKKRGTLVNSAHYQKFVSKLEEKKSGKDEETVSVEKMLEEIEKKADKKKGNAQLLMTLLKSGLCLRFYVCV